MPYVNGESAALPSLLRALTCTVMGISWNINYPLSEILSGVSVKPDEDPVTHD